MLCVADRGPRTAEEGKSRQVRTRETSNSGPRVWVLKNGQVPAKAVVKGRKSTPRRQRNERDEGKKA